MAKKIKAKVANYCQWTEYQKEPDMSYNTPDKLSLQYASELLHALDHAMDSHGVACINYEGHKMYATSKQVWQAFNLVDALSRSSGIVYVDGVNLGEVL